MLIVPLDVSSRPAIRRSSVDFPQPEGPTKTTNSPSSISRSISGMTVVEPNDFETLVSVIFPIISSRILPRRPSLHSTEGQAADKLALREPAHDEDRRDRQRRRSRKLCPEKTLRAGIGGDEGGQRRCLRRRQIECPERLVPGQDDVEQHG